MCVCTCKRGMYKNVKINEFLQLVYEKTAGTYLMFLEVLAWHNFISFILTPSIQLRFHSAVEHPIYST